MCDAYAVQQATVAARHKDLSQLIDSHEGMACGQSHAVILCLALGCLRCPVLATTLHLDRYWKVPEEILLLSGTSSHM